MDVPFLAACMENQEENLILFGVPQQKTSQIMFALPNHLKVFKAFAGACRARLAQWCGAGIRPSLRPLMLWPPQPNCGSGTWAFDGSGCCTTHACWQVNTNYILLSLTPEK